MAKAEELRQAIAALEANRATLGDEIVATALIPLRAQLAELEAAGIPPEQQRKMATVMFVDVAGSTEMSQGLEPEEILDIMDSALESPAAPVADPSPADVGRQRFALAMEMTSQDRLKDATSLFREAASLFKEQAKTNDEAWPLVRASENAIELCEKMDSRRITERLFKTSMGLLRTQILEGEASDESAP